MGNRENIENRGNMENRRNIENRGNIENRRSMENRGNIYFSIENQDSREILQNRSSMNQQNFRPETAGSINSENNEIQQFRAFSQQRYNPEDYQAPARRENVVERPTDFHKNA